MGNLGMPELLFILVLALLIFGPKKLPDVGKQVGKALGEFRRASNDLKRTIEDEMDRAGKDEPKGVEPPGEAEEHASEPAAGASPAAPGLAPEGTVPTGTARTDAVTPS